LALTSWLTQLSHPLHLLPLKKEMGPFIGLVFEGEDKHAFHPSVLVTGSSTVPWGER